MKFTPEHLQISAKAGTTKRVLAGFKAGVMWGLPERAEARTTYSQISAKAGTTKHALAGFKAGVMRGFQNGLKPELRTQKSRGNVEVVREHLNSRRLDCGTESNYLVAAALGKKDNLAPLRFGERRDLHPELFYRC
jgi:hypothetical protein